MVQKPRKHVRIYQDGRWRWADTGRWATKPSAGEIRQDRIGRPMDFRGRLVPLRSILTVEEAIERDRPLKKVPVPEISSIYVGEPVYTTSDGPEVTPQLFTQLSHFNKKYRPGDILNISEIFQNTFMAHAQKSALEPADIQTFQHGIQIRPREGEITPGMISYIQELLEGIPDARIVVLEEDVVNSIRIIFGDPMKPLNPAQTDRSLDEKESILSDIFGYIVDELGTSDWLVFFDTDEALYA